MPFLKKNFFSPPKSAKLTTSITSSFAGTSVFFKLMLGSCRILSVERARVVHTSLAKAAH